MACCGKARRQFHQATPSLRRPQRAAAATQSDSPTVVEYSGNTPMTVVGPVSGRIYQFDGGGARARVDPRDRSALRNTPLLRELG